MFSRYALSYLLSIIQFTFEKSPCWNFGLFRRFFPLYSPISGQVNKGVGGWEEGRGGWGGGGGEGGGKTPKTI